MSTVKRSEYLPDKVRLYIKEHKIDEVVTSTMNNVIRAMPEDPFGYLVEEFGKLCTSAPKFAVFRLDKGVPMSDLRFHVVMEFRGAEVRTHSLSLKGALLGDADASLAGFLKVFFSKTFNGRSVNEFLSFHTLCDGLADNQLIDLPLATAIVTEELLFAAARSLDMTRLDFFQHLLLNVTTTDSETGETLHVGFSRENSHFVSPPLSTPSDLSNWRAESVWPRLAMPVLHGGKGGLRPTALRCCAAISPFAASIAAGKDASDGLPPVGWVVMVVQALREAGNEAVKTMSADKAMKDLIVPGVSYGAVYGHPGGLAKSVQLVQKAAETAMGSGSEAEIAGVLFAAGDEAWIEDEGVYEMEIGKKLSLEQLVDLYVEAAEGDWLTMIVQPFRQADLVEGCAMLSAKKPGLRLIGDFGPTDVPAAKKGNMFSCALHATESAPLLLQRYCELAPLWKQAGGCGRCAIIDARIAGMVPSTLTSLLVMQQNEVVYFENEVADADISKMSGQVDELLYRVMSEGDGGETE